MVSVWVFLHQVFPSSEITRNVSSLGSGWWWHLLLPLHRSDSPSVFGV